MSSMSNSNWRDKTGRMKIYMPSISFSTMSFAKRALLQVNLCDLQVSTIPDDGRQRRAVAGALGDGRNSLWQRWGKWQIRQQDAMRYGEINRETHGTRHKMIQISHEERGNTCPTQVILV